MNKKNFEKFIEKYNLKGEVDEVVITASDNSLQSYFQNDGKDLIGNVKVNNINIPDGEFGIFATNNLQKTLRIFEDEVTFDINKRLETVNKLIISDDHVEAQISLASVDSIEVAKRIKNHPPFEIEFEITKDFIKRFSGARAALTNGNEKEFIPCAFVQDGSDIDIVLNLSDLEIEDRIKIPLNVSVEGDFPQLTYKADYIEKMMLSNKDFESGSLNVSSTGLLMVKFSAEDYFVSYYNVPLEDV